MRVAIAGAGNVGQSIARSLLATGHKVLLIERQWPHYRPQLVPDADWMFADACELASLQAAGIGTADVVIAATGDDKVNLVFALLAKSEFHVARVVARVNDPGNQWLFDGDWGVDVAVSTPIRLAAAVEEVVTIGEVVPLMRLHQGSGTIVELKLATTSRLVGGALGALVLPPEAAMLAVSRDGALLRPAVDVELAAGDELILLVASEAEQRVRAELVDRAG